MTDTDRGSATLEFVVVTVGFLLPLVALAVTVSEVTTATLAATTASRHAVRAFTRAESNSAGFARVKAVTTLALSDHGLDTNSWEFEVACSASRCLRRGSIDTVTVRVTVPLRFVPSIPGLSTPAAIVVERAATARVSIDSVNR